MKGEKLECDSCSKDCEELHTRETYRFGYAVEWVCKECYEEKFGLPWSDYVEDEEEVSA